MHNELDIKKVSRRGLVTLIVGFIGFVVWGSLVAMDRGVVVNGTLTFHGERKTIVHPHGGVVEKIWIMRTQLYSHTEEDYCFAKLKENLDKKFALLLKMADAQSNRGRLIKVFLIVSRSIFKSNS